MEDGVHFHLDQRDACKDPVGHGVADTKLVEGAIGGVIIGGIAAAIVGKSAGAALLGAVAGAAVGASLGANVPAKKAVRFEFRDVRPHFA